ncbi:cytochrome c [Chelativorans sp. ZYF759]|uniref:c-type cytochrome n=1 Tax=Chelativorans sp. ZYF759 TaxID=2692213 RepID=UPI001FF03182|nr:cytochrome c [Chelativorans sp. ZYF759]
MRPTRLAILILPALFAMTASAIAEHWEGSDNEMILRGRALVVENCSGCHAIGHGDASSHPQAPPFRDLSQFYPIDALEEAFIESIDTGHPGMPVFLASPQQIADILEYIYSVME